MTLLREQFAQNIREIRDYTGYTREQFSEILDIEFSTLASLERGITAPSFEMLEKLALKLKVEVWELFRFDPDFTSELKQRINRSITTNNS